MTVDLVSIDCKATSGFNMQHTALEDTTLKRKKCSTTLKGLLHPGFNCCITNNGWFLVIGWSVFCFSVNALYLAPFLPSIFAMNERNPDSRREANGWQRFSRTARLMLTWTSSIKKQLMLWLSNKGVSLFGGSSEDKEIHFSCKYPMFSKKYSYIQYQHKNTCTSKIPLRLSFPKHPPGMSWDFGITPIHSYSFWIGLEASFLGRGVDS